MLLGGLLQVAYLRTIAHVPFEVSALNLILELGQRPQERRLVPMRDLAFSRVQTPENSASKACFAASNVLCEKIAPAVLRV